MGYDEGMSKAILIVEDDPMQASMLSKLLQRKLDYDCAVVGDGRAALDYLASDEGVSVRIVMMDVNMPVMGGIEALGIIKERHPSLPVIMVTGSKEQDDALQAMKLGALDFINKPYEPERLLITVQNALKISFLSKEVKRLSQQQEGSFGFADLIGYDAGLAASVAIARKASSSDIPVLITGGTGTGKEVMAKAIHGESVRCGAPFVAVNCGAIPENLVESILFGHEKGSFTGATEKTIGKFREADGGTIFLDEVGELPLDTQVKLLRALQQKEVEPVGAGKSVPVNVRVISATNRDLNELVKEGGFREDLFYRLNVLHLELPSLNERKQDIAALALHFIDRVCARENRGMKSLSGEAVNYLRSASWPGNVRQLENAVSRAVVMSDHVTLTPDDFKSVMPEVKEQGSDIPFLGHFIDIQNHETGVFKTYEEVELELMEKVLALHNGNITRASDAIGMAKSTFYRKLPK